MAAAAAVAAASPPDAPAAPPAPPAPVDRLPPGWAARRLLTQPHRLGFAAAALVWAAGALAWALALLHPVPAVVGVPAVTLHALAFVLGPMPLFFAGFLFTSAPKWLRAPALPTIHLLPGVLACVLGWLLALGTGPWRADAAALGLALCAAGWALIVRLLVRLRRGATRRSRHFDAIAGVTAALVPVLAAASLALAAGDADLARRLARAALWGVVLPVFLLASHRLLPFLSHADAPQPDAPEPAGDALWVPALPLAASLAMAALSLAPATLAAQPALLLLRGGLHAAAALLTGWLVWRWARHPSMRTPLLRRLLRAFAWSGLGWLALAAAVLPGVPAAWRAGLDAAALHLLAMGFAGTTLLAMVSRLSLTLAGRPLAQDRAAAWLDGLLQAALLARLLAALWPAAAALALPLAASGWALLALAWLWQHGGLAGRPRTPPRGGA